MGIYLCRSHHARLSGRRQCSACLLRHFIRRHAYCGLVVAAIGYQMLFGGNTPNKAPIVRRDREDYAFFPIAMPGIAGPGTIAVVIGFSTEIAELTDSIDITIAFAWTALAIICATGTSWFVMRYSDVISNRLGPSGTLVLGKLMGFLLICIGVQFVGSGIRTFIAGS